MDAVDLPGLGGDGVGDLTGVGSVVHQQQLDVLLVAEEELSESIRQHVTSLFSRAITNLGESLVASELSTDSGINTVGSSPRSLYTSVRGRKQGFLRRLSCTYRKRSGWGGSSAS